MSIRSRKNSFQTDFTVSGRRIRRDFPTRGEAEAFEAETKLRAIRGESLETLVEPSSDRCDTMRKLMEATAARYWAGSKGERTTMINAEDVVTFLGDSFAPSAVDERQIDRLVGFFRKKGLSDSTINRKLAALSKILRHGYTRGYIQRLPKIDRPKEGKSRVRWFSYEDEDEITGKFKFLGMKSMEELVIFLADTGCRLSEVVGKHDCSTEGLKWRDVEGEYVRVWDGKNGDSRSIPMTDRVRELLDNRQKRCPEGVEKVFWDQSYWTIEDRWKQVRKLLGQQDDPQFVIHALRHTFCSRLIMQGADLVTVKELAGHKSLTVTGRYAHLHNSRHQAAVSLLNNRPQSDNIRLNPMDSSHVSKRDGSSQDKTQGKMKIA